MTALRFNISTRIVDGEGDEAITWNLDWDNPVNQENHKSEGTFYIPHLEQKWRGEFFSCNGFDMTVPEGTVDRLGFDNVWKHVNSVNAESPLHIFDLGRRSSKIINIYLIYFRYLLIRFSGIFRFSRDGWIWTGINR